MRHQKKTLLGSLAFLFLVAGTTAFAQGPAFSALDAEIADLNSAIQKKGAQWTAGETSLSRLSPEELKKRVGTGELKINAKPVPEDMGILSALPASLDWRSQDGDFVSAIKDQGNCGSCWAFAMTGGLESNALLTRAATGYANLSEQVLISCGGVGSCNGGTLNAKFLETTGLPPDSYYPYTATNGNCSAAAPDWRSATYKIGSWGSVSRRLSSIKSALAKYGPLPTSFLVFADFKHYKSGVYSHIPGLSDIFHFLGGHAVLIVGYNDDGQYFIVKNSWGKDWGEGGYFRIAYSELRTDSLFGLSTIAYQRADSGKLPRLVKSGLGDPAGKDTSQIEPLIEPLLKQRP